MTNKELKENITRLCAEYAKATGMKYGSIVVGVSINQDEVDTNLQITRYVSSIDTVD